MSYLYYRIRVFPLGCLGFTKKLIYIKINENFDFISLFFQFFVIRIDKKAVLFYIKQISKFCWVYKGQKMCMASHGEDAERWYNYGVSWLCVMVSVMVHMGCKMSFYSLQFHEMWSQFSSFLHQIYTHGFSYYLFPHITPHDKCISK